MSLLKNSIKSLSLMIIVSVLKGDGTDKHELREVESILSILQLINNEDISQLSLQKKHLSAAYKVESWTKVLQ